MWVTRQYSIMLVQFRNQDSPDERASPALLYAYAYATTRRARIVVVRTFYDQLCVHHPPTLACLGWRATIDRSERVRGTSADADGHLRDEGGKRHSGASPTLRVRFAWQLQPIRNAGRGCHRLCRTFSEQQHAWGSPHAYPHAPHLRFMIAWSSGRLSNLQARPSTRRPSSRRSRTADDRFAWSGRCWR